MLVGTNVLVSRHQETPNQPQRAAFHAAPKTEIVNNNMTEFGLFLADF